MTIVGTELGDRYVVKNGTCKITIIYQCRVFNQTKLPFCSLGLIFGGGLSVKFTNIASFVVSGEAVRSNLDELFRSTTNFFNMSLKI